MFLTLAVILVLFTPVIPPPGEKLSDSMYFNLTGCSATTYSWGTHLSVSANETKDFTL
jgi:hypothetical protein